MASVSLSFSGVTIPTNTTVSATIFENVSADDGYDSKDTISLSDGTTEYTTADVFDATEGNTYWFTLDCRSDDVTTTASITEPVTLELSKTFVRFASLSGSGSLTNDRIIVKGRSSSLSGDGSHTNTRNASKPRDSALSGNGSHTNTRSGTRKERNPIVEGEGNTNVFADLQEVFPDEEALDVTWDYYFDPRGFASEWLYEESNIPPSERGGFGVNFYGSLEHEIEVWIQYDENGDGAVDVQSQKQHLRNVTTTVTFDEHPSFGTDGYYRVFIRGLRQEDTVNQLDVGAVHQNL